MLIKYLLGGSGFIAALFAAGSDHAPMILFILALILLGAGILIGILTEGGE